MIKQSLPASRSPRPHYSLMRPGDFIWFVVLLIFSAWKFACAYGLAERYFLGWVSFASVSLVLTIWYAWIRIKRRHCCDDAGELMIALMLPQAYQMAFKHYSEGAEPFDWGLFWVFTLLLIVMAYRVWRAPQIAKELRELEAAAEEEARKGPADPRFIDIDNP